MARHKAGVKMKICFFGSEEFSIPSLSMLLESSHQVEAVITQPDKKRGRGLKEQATPVAVMARAHNIPVFQPETLKDAEFVSALTSLAVDLVVVCSYGKFLNRKVLTCPRLGCINIHPSLLPKYRGAMPIEGAIMAGEEKTGVSIFYMDKGCDTGDIIVQHDFPIDLNDTGGSLGEKLSHFAATVLKEALTLLDENRSHSCVQPEEGVCLTHCIEKEDTVIDWSQSPEAVRNFIRALWPAPAAQAFFRDRRLKLAPVDVAPVNDITAPPGTIIAINRNIGPVVACTGGAIQLRDLKPEGKKLMSAWQFTQGYGPKVGECLSNLHKGNSETTTQV